MQSAHTFFTLFINFFKLSNVYSVLLLYIFNSETIMFGILLILQPQSFFITLFTAMLSVQKDM